MYKDVLRALTDVDGFRCFFSIALCSIFHHAAYPSDAIKQGFCGQNV